MNRDQKAAAIAEIAGQIQEADAVFAVDYRGISVPQAAALRSRLRDADTSFRIVKNTLTERAADQAGAETLKELLEGPTALAFVRGDAATAAKAIADYARETDLLPFKGGIMHGAALEPVEISAIAKLPARDVLYGQLVGMVASPVSGLVRTLNALVGGLASQLGQIAAQKESDAPAAETETPDQDAEHEPQPVQPSQSEGEPERQGEDTPEETPDASETSDTDEDKE